MSLITLDTNRKVLLTPDQAIQKWFLTHREPLARITNQVSVIRNTPLFRKGFSKGLLALGQHLFVKLLIDTFPDIIALDDGTPEKAKFQLMNHRFAIALTSKQFGTAKSIITLKSNYKTDYLPEQESFADYILLVQLMDFEKSQPAKFNVLSYDTLRSLPHSYDSLKNLKLHTKHIHHSTLVVDQTVQEPYDVDQDLANTLIERALNNFLESLTGIATELIDY